MAVLLFRGNSTIGRCLKKKSMLDIKIIRENPKLVQEKIRQKGVDIDMQQILDYDERYRMLLRDVQGLQQKRNEIAKERNIEEGKKIKEELDIKERKFAKFEQGLKQRLLLLPNLPLDHLPVGDESQNKVIKTVGEPPRFNFTPKDHVEIGQALDIIDIPRATKVSGSRFAYLKGDGVLLELALVQFALKTLMEQGFQPVFPPVLIKKEMTEGLGYWHGKINEELTSNENYYLVRNREESSDKGVIENELYLVGTAEHALVPMHQGETLSTAELPKKYAGFSSCFRREAGTYGKDTKGILRVHQFDKVEMVEFVREEDDKVERTKMLNLAEKLMTELGLPYQLVQLSTGDISFPAAETIDIETWIPSQKRYRETHSISTTTDFQARRLNIKYIEDGQKKYAHILNGTAFAIGRTIIAILENYQQEDGTVIIPEVLRPFMGKHKISPKP